LNEAASFWVEIPGKPLDRLVVHPPSTGIYAEKHVATENSLEYAQRVAGPILKSLYL
jgi:hypothetical protein